eukprot:208271-Lingulodinium_polyedra.AAC.1
MTATQRRLPFKRRSRAPPPCPRAEQTATRAGSRGNSSPGLATGTAPSRGATGWTRCGRPPP